METAEEMETGTKAQRAIDSEEQGASEETTSVGMKRSRK